MAHPPGTFTGAHTVKLIDDNSADIGTASNPLYTSVTGAGSGGTSSVDKAAFTGGTSAGTGLMGVVTPTDVPVAADKLAIASLATDRSLNVTIVGGAGSGGNNAASATGSAVPSSADYQGINVAGTLRGAVGFDLDSGAGTEYAHGTNLRKIASGGSVEAGTATDPLRTDPTGATTQPVSGTVTANIGTVGTLATAAAQTTGNSSLSSIDGKITAVNTGAVVVSSSALPSGAATSVKQPALGTAGTASADVISVQGIASMTALKVDGSAVTQPISAASLPLPALAATSTLQGTTNTSLASIDGKITACNTGAVVLSSGTVTTVTTVTNLSQLGGVAIAMNTGVRSTGTQRVTIATDDVVPASQSGTWTVQPGNTANTTPWLITDTPATSGGLSKFHLVGAASDNVTNVKASAGQVYCITGGNLSASPRFLKFHNTASTPSAGSGVTDTYILPGNTSGAGFVINIDKGIAFATGIGISIVTGIADNSTTAIGASEVVINIYYK